MNIEDQVALEGRRDLCGVTLEEIERGEKPVAELIVIGKAKGRTEEFACLLGYEPPEGTRVISRQPFYLRPTE
jgi:hypothetical protein